MDQIVGMRVPTCLYETRLMIALVRQVALMVSVKFHAITKNDRMTYNHYHRFLEIASSGINVHVWYVFLLKWYLSDSH